MDQCQAAPPRESASSEVPASGLPPRLPHPHPLLSRVSQDWAGCSVVVALSCVLICLRSLFPPACSNPSRPPEL